MNRIISRFNSVRNISYRMYSTNNNINKLKNIMKTSAYTYTGLITFVGVTNIGIHKFVVKSFDYKSKYYSIGTPPYELPLIITRAIIWIGIIPSISAYLWPISVPYWTWKLYNRSTEDEVKDDEYNIF